MDFTLKRYKELLSAFKNAGYSFCTVEKFIRTSPDSPCVVLRHDVDRLPQHALQFARIEEAMQISASYYFRIVKSSFRPGIIKKIADLGHEVGYHYEDLSMAKGDYQKAISLFERHLERLRQFYPISTVCMHGSPLSRIDNRLIWEEYNYRDFGIIGEPYFDIDYAKALYITDTGRRWNDDLVNIRDRVEGLKTGRLKSSKKILQLLDDGQLNDILVINTHPNTWHSNYFYWMMDLIYHSMKNRIKTLVIKTKRY
jgi:hypothetical protein